MFAVGHMAFGYISGKTSSKLLKTSLNLPMVFMLSILPDADLWIQKIPFFQQFIQHHGATHSTIVAFIVFIPFFIVYRKTAVPYFIALAQHGLVGDTIAGRVQLLWPISHMSFGLGLAIRSLTNQSIEWIFFIIAILIMIRMKDHLTFFKPRRSNLILIVPALTVLLPTLLSTPMEVPVLLIPPHIFFLILFAASILIWVYAVLRLHISKKERPARAEEMK